MLNEIEDFITKNINNFKFWDFDYAEELAAKFGLEILSTRGTTRSVYKQKHSRKVIKVGIPNFNITEKSVWEALKNTPLQNTLAECFDISTKGYVLEQRFIPKRFPYSNGIKYQVMKDWGKIRDLLGELFVFVNPKKTGYDIDIHEENIRLDSKGNVVIIDYSTVGYDYFGSTGSVEKLTNKIRKKKVPFKEVDIKFKSPVLSLNIDGQCHSIDINTEQYWMSQNIIAG